MGDKTKPQGNFLAAVLNSVNALIVVLDRQGRIAGFNRACEQATGYAFEEVRGRAFSELFLQSGETAGVQAAVDELLSGKQSNQFKSLWVTRAGQQRSIAWSNTVMTDRDGQVEYIVATGLDVTDRKQLEEELRLSREHYQILFNNLHVPMLVIDPVDGQIVNGNSAACVFYGWDHAELTQRKITDINILPPGQVHQEMQRTLSNSSGMRWHFRHRIASGEIREVEVHSGPINMGTGQLLFSIILDITERVRGEEEVRSISRFPEENPNPILRFSLTGELLYANRSANLLLEQYGCLLSDVLQAELGELSDGLADGEARREIEVTCGGRIFSILLVVFPKAGYMNAYGSDITEQRQTELEIREYAKRLEAANEELQSFAYIASHDLQEPLRKVQAFGERLTRSHSAGLGEEGLDYLQRMNNAAARMDEMLRGLLTLSRVTTQAKPMARIDLNEVVEGVLADLELRLEQTGGQVTVEPLPEVEADPTQMNQLFQNLISNGLKFHKPGQRPVVRISGRTVQGEHGRWAEITVADEGIGFDPAFARRIFQPFQRLHGRGEYDGHGMGLAICRKIAERHGGTITAHGDPGRGSQFVVRLPAAE